MVVIIAKESAKNQPIKICGITMQWPKTALKLITSDVAVMTIVGAQKFYARAADQDKKYLDYKINSHHLE